MTIHSRPPLASSEPSALARSRILPFRNTEYVFAVANDGAGSLKHAIEIASKAHRGQINKANEPYIRHPLRVMNQVDSTDEKIVAVLHDVVEKNPQWPINRRASEGFKPKVIEAHPQHIREGVSASPAEASA